MAQITLLDGGMGQELVRRAGGVATPLWSTQALLDNPAIVTDVHRDYAKAGAGVATTDTYALHRDRLLGGASNHYASDGVDLPDLQHKLPELFTAALDAVDPVRDTCRIAGSIGPLGASYRADLLPAHDDAVALFGEAVRFLSPRSDILLFETVPGIAAARAALEAGRQSDLPVWLALTVDDTDGRLLRSGETVADVCAIAADADAALINCSIPEVIPAALDAIRPCGRPIGAYANGFTRISQDFIDGNTTANALSARTDLSPETYTDHAMSWLEHGATILGGCCEVGPAHIAEMAQRLRALGHDLV